MFPISITELVQSPKEACFLICAAAQMLDILKEIKSLFWHSYMKLEDSSCSEQSLFGAHNSQLLRQWTGLGVH
ncbi:hypothetical protein ACET3Z_013417 [Daucus carota]